MTAVSRKTVVACGAVLGMWAASVPAADLSYGFDVGVGYDDNITRVSGNELDDTIAAVGAQLRLDHESARITASIASKLEYREYLDDSFDSDVVGNFIAESKFAITPGAARTQLMNYRKDFGFIENPSKGFYKATERALGFLDTQEGEDPAVGTGGVFSLQPNPLDRAAA